MDYQTLARLVTQLSKLTVMAIDGRSCSGKTTLSDTLSREIPDVVVIHTDDFFLPTSMRSVERLSQVGGNINYEALAQVLSSLKCSGEATFAKYDCATDSQTLTTTRVGKQCKLIIVEGVYSAHIDLLKYIDIVVALTVDKQQQLQRLIKRNIDKVNQYVNVWLPLEDKYFQATDLYGRASATIDTSSK